MCTAIIYNTIHGIRLNNTATTARDYEIYRQISHTFFFNIYNIHTLSRSLRIWRVTKAWSCNNGRHKYIQCWTGFRHISKKCSTWKSVWNSIQCAQFYNIDSKCFKCNCSITLYFIDGKIFFTIWSLVIVLRFV